MTPPDMPQVATARPGDVLLMFLPDEMDYEAALEARGLLRDHLPEGIPLIVLGGGVRAVVAQPEPRSANTGAETSHRLTGETYHRLTERGLRQRQADAVRFAAGQAGKVPLAGRRGDELRKDIVRTLGEVATAVGEGKVRVP